MKCPYNNFEECFGFECPAYSKRTSGIERCRYVTGEAEQPHKTTIINNYYNNNEKGE